MPYPLYVSFAVAFVGAFAAILAVKLLAWLIAPKPPPEAKVKYILEMGIPSKDANAKAQDGEKSDQDEG